MEVQPSEFYLILKAGFMGFALCLGVLMLVFYVLGIFTQLSERNFMRVFLVAGLISFVALDLFLYYKIASTQTPSPHIFLAGCTGGWVGGIASGLTHMKKFLLSMTR